MFHSRQASNNSNQHSSLDDSGVVDDHEGDDVTSAEEHEKKEYREYKIEKIDPSSSTNVNTSEALKSDRVLMPVTVSVRTGNREIRVLKYNGVKTKKNLYTLPPEYLSHIVILGKLVLLLQ